MYTSWQKCEICTTSGWSDICVWRDGAACTFEYHMDELTVAASMIAVGLMFIITALSLKTAVGFIQGSSRILLQVDLASGSVQGSFRVLFRIICRELSTLFARRVDAVLINYSVPH